MLHLYRLRHPDDAEQRLFHSLVSLAAGRPDLYKQFDLSVGQLLAPHEPAAIHMAFGGNGRVEQAIWALKQPDVRRWVESGVPIIFDDSGEASLLSAWHWAALRRGVEELELSCCNLIWLLQNERAPRLCAEAFDGHPTIRAQAIVLHYWLHRLRIDARQTERPKRSDRRVRFVCLNNKLRPHRAAVLGNLINAGLIGKGLISLAKQTPGSIQFGWPTFEAFEAEAEKTYPAFAADIAAIRPMLDTDHTLGKESTKAAPIMHSIHAQAGFSLVNETEMTPGDVTRFTEKVLKPLATWHPFVVAGNPGTLKLLRQIGFKTFAPLIDEAYDDIVDSQDRLARALAEARRLITMPDAEFDRMLDRLEPVLEHNVNHFFNGLPSIMDAQHEAVISAVELAFTAEDA